ncbi:membrane protein containing DUF177 [Candidatus Magnetoovum chiemensis]|nr:membrane protein containing DUF177 [Candidatus Magnetoovum chiemensis]
MGDAGDIHLNADLEYVLAMSCSRCLTNIKKDMRLSFSLLCLPDTNKKTSLPSIRELTIEEMDEYYYSGDKITLSEIIQEQIILNIPFKALCKDTCKGLCPACAADLNVSSCECKNTNTANLFREKLLSTPGALPKTKNDVAIATPECPALTTASACFAFTISTDTLMEERFFFLIANDVASFICTVSGACSTLSLSLPLYFLPRRLLIISLSPTNITSISSCWLIVSIAPITVSFGALSPPIASNAIIISLLFF